MKRFYFILACNIVFASFLAFLTVDIIQSLHRQGLGDITGWLAFSAAGSFEGVAPLLLFLAVLLMDSLWILFFIIWILKRVFHIKDTDNTLYLP